MFGFVNQMYIFVMKTPTNFFKPFEKLDCDFLTQGFGTAKQDLFF